MFISFTNPIYLFFLFGIPVMIFFHFYGLRNLKGRALKFANFEAIARVKGIDLYSKNIFTLVFDIFFIVLLVAALSGLTVHQTMAASSFSFVIALDNSQSMSATDLSPSRLESAKEAAKTFIDSLPTESSVGIISFSGESVSEQGITRDKQALRSAIDNIQLSNVGGTDIFEAVSNSINLLKGEKNKAIILLSDGQINVGNLSDAVDYARYNQAVIHTFGIGTSEGGSTSYGLSKLDEDSLKALAYGTGGKYFNVKTREELQSSFSSLVQITERIGEISLSTYLLMAAVVLFIIKQFLLSINRIVW